VEGGTVLTALQGCVAKAGIYQEACAKIGTNQYKFDSMRRFETTQLRPSETTIAF
jgi:hypothetical protein